MEDFEDDLRLVIGFLEINYASFQTYLENEKELPGFLAEMIITKLEKVVG